MTADLQQVTSMEPCAQVGTLPSYEVAVDKMDPSCGPTPPPKPSAGNMETLDLLVWILCFGFGLLVHREWFAPLLGF